MSQTTPPTGPLTVVLVHGAFADASSWAGVIERLQASRAGATITEVEGSHVIMISQPQVVTDVILRAVAAGSSAGGRLRS